MLLSFDVFGTLVNVRESSYEAFRSILSEYGRPDADVRAFWEYWEERNIAHYCGIMAQTPQADRIGNSVLSYEVP